VVFKFNAPDSASNLSFDGGARSNHFLYPGEDRSNQDILLPYIHYDNRNLSVQIMETDSIVNS
jgi:hypothetical protein